MFFKKIEHLKIIGGYKFNISFDANNVSKNSFKFYSGSINQNLKMIAKRIGNTVTLDLSSEYLQFNKDVLVSINYPNLKSITFINSSFQIINTKLNIFPSGLDFIFEDSYIIFNNSLTKKINILSKKSEVIFKSCYFEDISIIGEESKFNGSKAYFYNYHLNLINSEYNIQINIINNLRSFDLDSSYILNRLNILDVINSNPEFYHFFNTTKKNEFINHYNDFNIVYVLDLINSDTPKDTIYENISIYGLNEYLKSYLEECFKYDYLIKDIELNMIKFYQLNDKFKETQNQHVLDQMNVIFNCINLLKNKYISNFLNIYGDNHGKIEFDLDCKLMIKKVNLMKKNMINNKKIVKKKNVINKNSEQERFLKMLNSSFINALISKDKTEYFSKMIADLTFSSESINLNNTQEKNLNIICLTYDLINPYANKDKISF